jgi:protein-L-isoaspartate(D-aspartate) O-methyltransferase
MDTPNDKWSGIGMTSARTRTRMVERLREQGIRDEVVLSAMHAVPRHIFVDEALAIRAYEDSPLPIGHGQTISQPWVVARMSELARNGRTLDGVLEIGTGCGYQTAVLAQFAVLVYSVERIAALLAISRRNLQSLKIRNVRLKHGDGSADLGEALQVDAIVVTAAATQVA